MRQGRPGQGGGAGEGHGGGLGGGAAVRPPQQRREQQQGRLERGGEPDKEAGRALGGHPEDGQQHQQHGQDGRLPGRGGLADGQRDHHQADQAGRGEQCGAPRHGVGQSARGDEPDGGDQQQRRAGPGHFQRGRGQAEEGLEDEPGEGGAGELAGVVERAGQAARVGEAELAEPLARRYAQHGGGLPDGEDSGQRPEQEPRRREPVALAYDPGMSVRTAVLCRVSHASPASRPVERNLDLAWLPHFMHHFIAWEDDIPRGIPRMASMSIVKINVLTVPAEQREVLEQRFASRAGAVEGSDGFEWFELLRPVEGTDQYLVYTRWRSEEDFQAWMEGPMKAAHQGGGAGERPKPAASGSTVWSFEVVQQAGPKQEA